MRFLIQRVKEASVTVEAQPVGKIGQGFLVLVGICQEDTYQIADKMIKKLLGLRIFADEEGKTNLDLKTVSGELLMISQFTLYADCRKGNRPSFTRAGDPQMALKLYQYIVEQCRLEVPGVREGVFGAHMEVKLINDGPFTVLLDSQEIC